MTERFDRIAPGLPAKLNLLFDAALVALALVAASGNPGLLRVEGAPVLVLVAVVSWFTAAALLRLYSPCTPRGRSDALVLGALAAGAVALVTTLVGLLLGLVPAPVAPWRFGLLLLAGTALMRLLFARPRHLEPTDAVLVVGTGPLGRVTYGHLTAQAAPPRRVLGFLRFPGEPAAVAGATVPVLGEAEHLLALLSAQVVHEVYIAGRVGQHGSAMQEVVRVCEEVGVPFAVPLHSLRFERATLLSSSPARDGYLHYLTSRPRPGHYAAKRLVDIAASSVALVLFAPLLAGVALAIKLTSRGPVLYRQVRAGLHGAPFNLLKFRSMVTGAEAMQQRLAQLNEQSGPVFKIKNDPRVTKVGRLLRRLSLDELPQLVNVLRGDMTLVGPRPALPDEVAQYKAWQRRRLSVRPGLTCYWQVTGRDAIGFEEWMRLDLRYVDNWSLTVDLRLILQTFPAVIAGKGAS